MDSELRQELDGLRGALREVIERLEWAFAEYLVGVKEIFNLFFELKKRGLFDQSVFTILTGPSFEGEGRADRMDQCDLDFRGEIGEVYIRSDMQPRDTGGWDYDVCLHFCEAGIFLQKDNKEEVQAIPVETARKILTDLIASQIP